MLPHYMNHLGSTGRFHVGFAERGLKQWAKIPASTSQKRGRGVFEGQCASRIQERSMINHALRQMVESDDETYNEESTDAEQSNSTKDGIGGSLFLIKIFADPENARLKKVTAIRLDYRNKPHKTQVKVPIPILDHFKRESAIGTSYEYRTEVTIDTIKYRAHPDYSGNGPWYDFALVQFDLDMHDHSLYVNDYGRYPAKLV